MQSPEGNVVVHHLPTLQAMGYDRIPKLPFSIKVLLESALRNCDNYQVTEDDVIKLAEWKSNLAGTTDIAFKPARVVLQDFTGVPAVVDLAAMRSAMHRMGGDTTKINPLVPCDLVIDHSVQVDSYGSANALAENVEKEFIRNKERYEFLKWGQKSLKNFRAVPPATGIVHQVNLEYLANGVLVRNENEELHAFPDSLVGTDSHTTMINGIGVAGWGVGGIEAEAVMLGEPIYMVMPQVIGFKLTGAPKEGITATDIVLTVVELLRKKGVVGKFVEFFGDGMVALSVPDRATLANMAPEYGATMGFFPVDQKTLDFYKQTARDPEWIDFVGAYSREQGMFYEPGMEPEFTDVIEFDLSLVEPCLAGPKRPQDRVNLKDMKSAFKETLVVPIEKRGFALGPDDLIKTVPLETTTDSITHGSVVIAAITSCTNTSNPSVMIGAGLVAKAAVDKGLNVKPYIKTSLAPGSTVVTEYLKNARLIEPLEKLNFHIVGYGCTTCIGNSGPLPEIVSNAITSGDLVACSVLSGNRNFEGRVNPHVKANYLASPPLVVAYAIAGRVDIDFDQEPLGKGKDGQDVYLKDIWPTNADVQACLDKAVTTEAFAQKYQNVFEGSPEWVAIHAAESEIYPWEANSSYIQEPPFFEGMQQAVEPISPIKAARVLVKLGDSVTTDHISPAGAIGVNSPAGKYLKELGIESTDFNSYGSRRGNDRVMTRGTFANIRLRNQLVPGSEGSCTKHFPSGEETDIHSASLKYAQENVPLVVLAGKEYGTGSSRDWAAKGTRLLGVRVVIAESYERIHRSNLVGMGVLPLQYADGQTAQTLGLKGDEVFDFDSLNDDIKPQQNMDVAITFADGSKKTIQTLVRIDTPVEVDYYRNGGILHTVIRKLLK
ncbi:MAG: aconitate hydratase [Candidatus Omnitrophota bacterium]|jgi:aconitate hydratase